MAVVSARLGYRLHDKKRKNISLPANGTTNRIAKTKCQALTRRSGILQDL